MLIVGCGDVGRRIAHAARTQDTAVHCVVRSRESAQRLRQAGYETTVCDLEMAWPAHAPIGAEREVFYLAPPPPEGRSDPRIGHFLQALPTVDHQRIVYISTTGVYGDCNGDWVDESRSPAPRADRAYRRLDAEQQLHAWQAAGERELVILRVAGIYGPGKLPVERLQRQVPMVGEDEAPWTNRIHIDDLVTVCLAAMARGRNGGVYNVSDGQPGNMRDYFDRVADLYGLPRAPLIRLAAADGRLSAGLLSYLAESRRLDNSRMRTELGVRLRYPDLASGLAACTPDAGQTEVD
ncbi:MAG: SDR family oxidoreductase [Gammaproteobacteria bacterium]|nr:SDR family oxidoreductase [Gammaproteobacteria bacterium]MCB1923677.1 SDR family oxidoreductase [Gammaproteobacteria bacterium]